MSRFEKSLSLKNTNKKTLSIRSPLTLITNTFVFSTRPAVQPLQLARTCSGRASRMVREKILAAMAKAQTGPQILSLKILCGLQISWECGELGQPVIQQIVLGFMLSHPTELTLSHLPIQTKRRLSSFFNSLSPNKP